METAHKEVEQLANKINKDAEEQLLIEFNKWFFDAKRHSLAICPEIFLAKALCRKYNRNSQDEASVVFTEKKGGA